MDVKTIIKNAGLRAAMQIAQFNEALHRIAVCSLVPDHSYEGSRKEALAVARERAKVEKITPYQTLCWWWNNLTASGGANKLMALMVNDGIKRYDSPEDYNLDRNTLHIMVTRAKHWKKTEALWKEGKLGLPKGFEYAQN